MEIAMPTAAEKKEQERWESESDVRTLIDAGRIKKDKKRMKRARSMMKEQRAALEEAANAS